MTTIVKQSVFAVTQSSAANTPELSDAIWGCPMTHTPIATLRFAMAWTQKPKRHGGRNLRGSKPTALFPLLSSLRFYWQPPERLWPRSLSPACCCKEFNT